MKIKTKFKVEEIKCVDFFTSFVDKEERHNHKYNSPICLRYFNTILVSACCSNYICHLCAFDFKHREEINPEVGVKCPLCNNLELDLHDVNPDDKVKRYTDSPVMSFYSSIMSKGADIEERKNTVRKTMQSKVLSDRNSYIWNRSKFQPQRNTFTHFANEQEPDMYGAEDQKGEDNGHGAGVPKPLPFRTQEIVPPVQFELSPDGEDRSTPRTKRSDYEHEEVAPESPERYEYRHTFSHALQMGENEGLGEEFHRMNYVERRQSEDVLRNGYFFYKESPFNSSKKEATRSF